MSEALSSTLLVLPDAGQGTSQHPAGQGFPGEVFIFSSKPEFSRPPVDPGPFWARVLDRVESLVGPGMLTLLALALDKMDDAIEEGEKEAKERELEAEIQLKRMGELWELVKEPEVDLSVRLNALWELATRGLTPEVEGWFGKLEEEKEVEGVVCRS